MPEGRFLLYLLSAVLPVVALLGVIGQSTSRQDVALVGEVANKVVVYRENSHQFDTIFLGDSRTYCAIHPHRVNELMGVRAANLASWAHWLPTQYAQIKDILQYIPDGATVIWSVGYQNFLQCVGCSTLAYPIGKENADFYAQLGLPKVLYEENLRTLPPLSALSNRTTRSYQARLFELNGAILKFLQSPVTQDLSANRTAVLQEISPHELEYLRAQEHVADAAIVYFQGQPTSIEVTYQHGGYERVELDRDFFRAKQKQVAPQKDKLANPAFVRLFEAGLDLFATQNVNVIVNVMEEAPHTYYSREEHLQRRQYMDTQVRQAVESRGFRYVRVDFDQLSSSQYFDYNHLNSDGADRFVRMLTAELRETSS